jgi:hypothetical protein
MKIDFVFEYVKGEIETLKIFEESIGWQMFDAWAYFEWADKYATHNAIDKGEEVGFRYLAEMDLLTETDICRWYDFIEFRTVLGDVFGDRLVDGGKSLFIKSIRNNRIYYDIEISKCEDGRFLIADKRQKTYSMSVVKFAVLDQVLRCLKVQEMPQRPFNYSLYGRRKAS